MMIRTLAAGAALAVLVSGAASAAPQPKGPATAAPKQPIPYSQLSAYLKASPKTRATKDWWNGAAPTGAPTGASIDTSATLSAAWTSTDASVTPSAPAAMPSDSGADLPATPSVRPEGSNPAPDSNLPGSVATPGALIEPE